MRVKITRLDDKLAKVKEVVPKPIVAPVEEPAPVKAAEPKKKLDRAQLKAKIQNFNNNLLAVQEKNIKSIPVEKPVIVDTPVTAAFEKYRDLASSDIDIKCTLTLPISYARILESFKGSDTIIKFLNNRQETCTFLKLKLGIQNITKHTFLLKHLAQIKTVYPLAYYYKQEKMFIDFKNDYHLTICPNLDEVTQLNEKGVKEFSPSVLLTRLNKFKTSLFNMVKNYHQKFLESIGITNVDFKDIKRWHPKFDIESCLSIEESELPKSPNESIKVKTGQDLLNIAKEVYSSRIQDAIKEHTALEKKIDLEIVDSPKAKLPMKTDPIVKTPKTPLTKDEKLMSDLKDKKEKTYNSLLEKIRNKEKTKHFESMIINSDKEKKLAKYGLYKDSIRFLLFFFQAEKKSTINMETVNTRMADNLKEKLSETEVRELLVEMTNDSDLHCEANTKWISVIRVRNLSYIKMDRAHQLNDLWARCDKLIEQLK
jgi:chromatin licensing and DNA replication factor 1